MATRGRQRSRTTVGKGPPTPKFSSAMWAKRAAESRKDQPPKPRSRHTRSSSLTRRGDDSPPDSGRTRSLTVTAAASRGGKSGLQRSESTRKLMKVRDRREKQAKKKQSSRSKSGMTRPVLSPPTKSKSARPRGRAKKSGDESESAEVTLDLGLWTLSESAGSVASPRRGTASAGASPAAVLDSAAEVKALKKERDSLLARVAELEKSLAEQRQTIIKLKGPRKSLTDQSGGGLPSLMDSMSDTSSTSGPSRELARLRGVNCELQSELCDVRQSRDKLSRQLAKVTAERDALKAKAK